MKKALMVSSIYGFFPYFEKSDIKILQSLGYDVYVASNMSKSLGANGDNGQMEDLSVTKIQIDFSRNPFSTSNIKAYFELSKLLKCEHFDLIHCHTPIASVITRICARKYRKGGTKVLYTAHGFHFYKNAPKPNWIYYPIECFCSKFTDVLITINKEDYEFAKKRMKCSKVEYIPGIGVDTKKFNKISINKNDKRKELGIPTDAILLLSVGELRKLKNHRTIINALVELNDLNIFYIVAGQGKDKNYLTSLYQSTSYKNNVKLLGYRKDIAELCLASDIFCFPSEREGLGIAALEAMMMGLPIITSNIHGIKDYSIHGVSGYACCPHDIAGFKNAISVLSKDERLRNKMGEFNKENVKQFDIERVKLLMRKIYTEVGNEL